VPEITKRERFEQTVLPHLDAAYNLARWLTGNEHDAQDVTQEACLRAFRFFEGYQGGNMRAWLLTIVRNSCYTWLRRNRPPDSPVEFDEEIHGAEFQSSANPEIQVLASADKETIHRDGRDVLQGNCRRRVHFCGHGDVPFSASADAIAPGSRGPAG
jgi:RNA polymerase sigma factor (sigma-70 family)